MDEWNEGNEAHAVFLHRKNENLNLGCFMLWFLIGGYSFSEFGAKKKCARKVVKEFNNITRVRFFVAVFSFLRFF